MKIAVYNDKENCMKIKNIVIACAMIFGLSFAVSDGYAFAEEDTLRTFEEFVQDENSFAKWEKDHAAHIKKIQELKDERRVRRLEYKAFTHNPNAEPKQISKAARDIVMLDRQIQTLNEEFIKNTRENYGVDFMGFEFHRNRTVMRKGIMIRLNRKARQVSRQEKINPKDAASLLSSMGWVRHTDTYGMYEERIKPIVSIKKLKKVVSKNQKRINRKEKEARKKTENHGK